MDETAFKTFLTTLVLLIVEMIITHSITKEILDFIFFADKTKSFRKKFRKHHNIFYRFFLLYVYNRTYMEESRYRKRIYIIYSIYFLYNVGAAFLILLTILLDSQAIDKMSIITKIYCFPIIPYFIWYLFHSWDRKTWTRFGQGDFRCNLPGLEEVKRRRNFK